MKPFDHQVVGIQALVTNPFFALFDEMGAGKTKQVIDAAQVLFWMGVIDQVIVVCPAAVRSVWFNMELGELAKHLWETTPSVVTEYHAQLRTWTKIPEGITNKDRHLRWVVTNYDYIRRQDKFKKYSNLNGLKPDQRTLLVLDESSAVKSHDSHQTRSCHELRLKCGRVVLCNGTPIANNPMDLYSQGQIMSASILGCKNVYQYRARYAKMGGYLNREIIGWVNLPDLQQRFQPYVLRRLKEDVLKGLPPKLPPVVISIPMTPKTWSIYKSMRDDMVAWLSDTEVSVVQQAMVKSTRLAQITSGFLGGIETETAEVQTSLDLSSDRPAWIPGLTAMPVAPTAPAPVNEDGEKPIQWIGTEKLDGFCAWLGDQLGQYPNFKLLTWFFFRPELFRAVETIKAKFPKITVVTLVGGQKPAEREHALQTINPRTAPEGPVVALGIVSVGGMGIDGTACQAMAHVSHTTSMKDRLQSDDRIHRPGQIHWDGVSYFDFVLTGPNGQKTIDHTRLKAQQGKINLATFTQSAWLDELKD